MLILARAERESITVGESVVFTICEVRGSRVRVGVDAPEGMAIQRTEKPLNKSQRQQTAEVAACVLLAMEHGELSEGQAAAALGVDPVALREQRERLIARGVEAAEKDWEKDIVSG